MKNLLAFLILSFSSANSFAENYHEHFVLYPEGEDVLSAIDSAMLNPSTQFSIPLDIANNFPGKIHVFERRFQELAFQINDPQIHQILYSKDRSQAVLKLTPQNWAKYKGLLAEFLTVNSGTVAKGADAKSLYRIVENTRREILRPEYGELIKHAYVSTLTRQTGRGALDVTLPGEFFISEEGKVSKQLSLLSELQATAKKEGRNISYFYSIPRNYLHKDLLNSGDLGGCTKSGLGCLEELLSAKDTMGKRIIEGLDITGSLEEARSSGNYKIGSLQKVLEKVSDLNIDSKNPIQVRLHAFEGSGSGSNFYSDLDSILANPKLDKLELRIGHISALPTDPVSLSRFTERCARVKGCNLIFEANLESNMRLQKADLKELALKIHLLKERGLTVVPGADGEGVLRDAKLSRVLKRLRTRFPDDPIVQAIAEDFESSKNPNYLKTVGAQSLKLRREKYLDSLAIRIAKKLCN